jgi:hypothetical protein
MVPLCRFHKLQNATYNGTAVLKANPGPSKNSSINIKGPDGVKWELGLAQFCGWQIIFDDALGLRKSNLKLGRRNTKLK